MALLDEMEAIVTFIEQLYPDRLVDRQKIPLDPPLGNFVVRFTSDSREIETASSVRNNRIWDIVYFGHDVRDTLEVMDKLMTVCADQRLMIPIPDTLSYLRVKSVSFSKPFINENTIDVIIGVFITETRTALSQEHYETVQKASIVLKP